MRVVTSLLLTAVAINCFGAETLYVTQSSPPIHPYYLTITAALAAVENGDTIIIEQGPIKVNGEWSHVLWNDEFGNGSEPKNLVAKPTMANVTIKGATYGNHVVTINGNGNTSPLDYGFNLTGVNNTIENLKLVNCKRAGVVVTGFDCKVNNTTFDGNYRQGLRVQGDDATVTACIFTKTKLSGGQSLGCSVYNSGCKIKDCESFENEAMGYRVFGPNAVDVTLENCDSYDNGFQGAHIQGAKKVKILGGDFYSNDASGIQIENECDDVVIRGVRSSDNNLNIAVPSSAESGIWVNCSKNVLIEDCRIYNNQLGIYVNSEAAQPGYTEDVIIRFNRIYNNTKNTMLNPPGAGIAYTRVKRLAAYHNTIWNNGTTSTPQQGVGIEDGFDRGGFGARLGRPGIADEVTSDLNERISFKNNVVGKTYGRVAAHVIQFYEHNGSLNEVEDVDTNVYYSPTGTVNTYHIRHAKKSFSQYKTYMAGLTPSQEVGTVESATQPIANSSLTPFSNGDAHDAASSLTDINYVVSGNWIQVSNATYFREGDQLRFTGPAWGSTVAEISGNWIKLTSTPSSSMAGAGVWLDRPFYGTKPDIGAKEN